MNNVQKKRLHGGIDDSKKVRWGRSKLMVIGQGGAGKTSTVRCLLGQAFNPEWDSTVGASLKKTDTTAWMEKEMQKTDFEEAAARAVREQYQDRQEQLAIEREKYSKNQQMNLNGLQAVKELNRDVMKPPPWEKLKVTKKQPTTKVQTNIKTEKKSSEKNDIYESLDTTELAIDKAPMAPENFESKDPKQNLLAISDVARRFKQRLMTNALDGSDEDDDKLTFTIWDYGGQTVFYTLHHLFLTQYGVYLIVFDLNKLSQQVEGDEAVQFLQFWMNSVMLHAPEAPAILVGTHLDDLRKSLNHKKKKNAGNGQSDDYSLAKFFDYVNKMLEEDVKVTRHAGVIKNKKEKLWFFPLENSTGENIEGLRKEIDDAARGKKYVNQEIPLRWVLTLDMLINEAESKIEAGRSWVSFEEVREIAKAFKTTSLEVTEMLKLFHELGVLVYLGTTDALRETVVINPQWLIEMLGKVIRDDMHGMPAGIHKALYGDWDALRKKGVASRDLLDEVWRESGVVPYLQRDAKQRQYTAQQSQFLIDLMRNAMLLSEWSWGNSDKSVPLFIIPSLLRSTEQDIKALNDKLQSWDRNTSSSLFLDFSEFFLPTGVFQRLVCLLVSLVANQIKDAVEPVLGKQYALVSFIGKANKAMSTELYLTLVEGDKIMISAKKGSHAPDLLLVVLSLVRRMREEVMGGRLKVKIILTNLIKKAKPAPKVDTDAPKSTKPIKTKTKNRDVLQNLAPSGILKIGPQADASAYEQKEFHDAKSLSQFKNWFIQDNDKKKKRHIDFRIDTFLCG